MTFFSRPSSSMRMSSSSRAPTLSPIWPDSSCARSSAALSSPSAGPRMSRRASSSLPLPHWSRRPVRRQSRGPGQAGNDAGGEEGRELSKGAHVAVLVVFLSGAVGSVARLAVEVALHLREEDADAGRGHEVVVEPVLGDLVARVWVVVRLRVDVEVAASVDLERDAAAQEEVLRSRLSGSTGLTSTTSSLSTTPSGTSSS